MNKKIVFIFLSICASLLVAGCAKKPPDAISPSISEYRVTFVDEIDGTSETEVLYMQQGNRWKVVHKGKNKFLGYYTVDGICVFDSNGTQSYGFAIDRDLTLYARWQYYDCTVSFDAGGGELREEEKHFTQAYGAVLTKFPVPKKEGCVFSHWSNSKGEAVSDGAKPLEAKRKLIMKDYPLDDANVTILKASYETQECTITFNWNDGSYETERMKCLYGDFLDESSFPTREDDGKKELLGWSVNPDRYVEFEGPVKGDVSLYAIWREYKVLRFYSNDSEYEEYKVYKNEEFTLPTLEAPNGYIFDGWYTTKLFNGAPVESLSYSTASKELYARFVPITYTIVFDTRGGDAVLPEVKYTIEDTVDLPSAGVKVGSVFVGWCKLDDLSDVPFTVLPQGTFGDMTLYAKWQDEASGGSGERQNEVSGGSEERQNEASGISPTEAFSNSKAFSNSAPTFQAEKRTPFQAERRTMSFRQAENPTSDIQKEHIYIDKRSNT